MTEKHHYTIDPRSSYLGGGWRLRLYEGSEEIGGGAFPAIGEEENKEAYAEAQAEADDWLAQFQDSVD